MSIIASELIARVTAIGVRETQAQLMGVGVAADDAGARLGKLATGGTVLAAAGLALLIGKVTSMAGNFEQATETLVTGAGEQQSALDRVRQGILKTAVDTATGTKPLIDAMFLIESAGYRGAQGLTVLKDSAEEAKVGNADLGKVADVLTTVLHNYHLGVSQAVPVLNSFNKTVGDGKMYLDQLDAALTNVLPAAAAARVKFTDVEGALATMSESGDKGAAAGTHLSQMFLSLEKPTSAATKVLKEVGLTTQQISDDMKKSLPDTLQLIYDALAKKFPPGSAAFNAAAATIVGGTRQMKAWNELTGQSFGDLIQKTADISASYKKGGQDVTGWAAVQGEFNTKLGRAGEVMETLGIKAGTVLLPVLGKMLDQVPSLVNNFSNWLDSSHALDIASQGLSNSVGFLGNVIGTVAGVMGNIISAFRDTGAGGQALRAALVALGVVVAEVKLFQLAQGAAGAFMAIKNLIPTIWSSSVAFGALDLAMGPIALVIGGIALAAGAAMLVFTHWDQITQGVGATFDAFGRSARQTFSNTTTAVTQGATSMGGAVHNLQLTSTEMANHIVGDGVIVARSANATGAKIVDMSQTVQQTVQQMNTNVSTASQSMASNLLNAVSGVVGKAGKSFDQLLSQVDMDMSSIDQNSKQYWADVMNYIEKNPINGHIVISGPEGVSIQTSATTQAHASGTSYAPGGWSWVGERGPEMMYVPRGAQIVPHAQSVGQASGGAGGSPVQVNINIAGHNVARVLLPEIVTAIRNATAAKF